MASDEIDRLADMIAGNDLHRSYHVYEEIEDSLKAEGDIVRLDYDVEAWLALVDADTLGTLFKMVQTPNGLNENNFYTHYREAKKLI